MSDSVLTNVHHEILECLPVKPNGEWVQLPDWPHMEGGHVRYPCRHCSAFDYTIMARRYMDVRDVVLSRYAVRRPIDFTVFSDMTADLFAGACDRCGTGYYSFVQWHQSPVSPR